MSHSLLYEFNSSATAVSHLAANTARTAAASSTTGALPAVLAYATIKTSFASPTAFATAVTTSGATPAVTTALAATVTPAAVPASPTQLPTFDTTNAATLTSPAGDPTTSGD